MEAGGRRWWRSSVGAGLTIPSARCEAEDVAERFGTTLVHISPIDDMAPISSPVGVGIPLGITHALSRIWKQIRQRFPRRM